MVDFGNLDDVDDRHGDVDVDREVDIVYFVKAKRCDLLVVGTLPKIHPFSYRDPSLKEPF